MPWWAWTALLVPAGLAAASILPHAKLRPSLAAGLFLVGLDLVVENAGAWLGWWTTHGALLSVGVTPVEVVVLAFLAGACLGPALEAWPGPEAGLVVVLAVGGAAIEHGLRLAGMMSYHGPWNAAWAVLAYAAALAATRLVHRILVRRASTVPPAVAGD